LGRNPSRPNPTSAFSFRIEQCLLDNGVMASRIEWGNDAVPRTADEILQATATANDTSQLEAENFLRDVLSGGEALTEDVECEARAAGLLGTVQRIGHNKTFRKARTGTGRPLVGGADNLALGTAQRART
jgi:hypothetical protein